MLSQARDYHRERKQEREELVRAGDDDKVEEHDREARLLERLRACNPIPPPPLPPPSENPPMRPRPERPLLSEPFRAPPSECIVRTPRGALSNSSACL